jgi:hypothetical protein
MSKWGVSQVGNITFDHLKQPGARMMRRIGVAAKTMMQTDAQEKGVDENGRPFRPYSAAYKKLRRRAGYGTKVDLTVDNLMFQGMSVTSVTARSVTIGFINTRASGTNLSKKAQGLPSRTRSIPSPEQKAKYTNRLRPWFGFGRRGSHRRKEIQRRGFNIFLEEH